MILKQRILKSLRRTFRRTADRAVLSTVNGLVYFADKSTPSSMGSAPRDLVMRQGKLSLHRLRRGSAEQFELGGHMHEVEHALHTTPVLVIPPLMVRPYIYDLRPEHSMLRELRNGGFDVFVVDFGVPDKSDEHVRLDDYILDYLPRCIDSVLEKTGAKTIALVGYCMGGIFALAHVGTFADDRVRAIVTIGSPVNFDKMGIVTLAAQLSAPSMDRIIDLMGNVPGSMSSLAFKLMSGPRTLSKYGDLLWNLHDENYVRAFRSINTWTNDMIPYPKEAFRQMFKEVVHANKLLKNDLHFGELHCDLKQVHCPLLAFAGRTDSVATPASTREIIDLISSVDKTLVTVDGGHVGVVAGKKAPIQVWKPIVQWLQQRLEERNPSLGYQETGPRSQNAKPSNVPHIA